MVFTFEQYFLSTALLTKNADGVKNGYDNENVDEDIDVNDDLGNGRMSWLMGINEPDGFGMMLIVNGDKK